jgi:cytochrome bd ubiquinol oxidase subunit II
MIATWYAIVSLMLVVYVVLDGRNFGAGMLQRFVATTADERRQVVAAIGPLWSWHEVWLVGFGGTLVAVFPRLIASAFAGYYLALMLILWALILRGISIEAGRQINDPLWRGLWDFVFAFASFLLAILFGAAAGNQVRGVPLGANGNFSMAFFTNFTPRGYVGLLDWYTVSSAIFTVTVLAAHGATYLTVKTAGPVHDRCLKWAKRLWLTVVPLFFGISIESWIIRPRLAEYAISRPFCWIGALLVVVAACAVLTGLIRGDERRAFVGSNLFLAGLLVTGSAAFFPVMLYSTLAPANSLTAYNVSAGAQSFLLASYWWPVGFVLTTIYFLFISKRYAGKVSVVRDNQTYY